MHLKLLPDEPKSSQSSAHDRDNAQNILPSTTALAQSFLESEPQGKKAELQAAISSQSQYLQHPVEFSEDEEEELGLGQEGVALPSFVAGFLKGIGDRLQVKISDVQLRLDMEVRQDGFQKGTSAGKPDPVTAFLSVQNISVDGVIPPSTADEATAADTTVKVGKRLITLSQIQGLLISDSTVFSNYSRFSSPESPSTAHSKASQSQFRSFSPPPPHSSDSSSILAMSQSTILEPSQDIRPSVEPDEPLEESTISTTGRFSDAGTDAEYDYDAYLDEANDPLSESQYDDRLLDDPSYLEEAINSQFNDDIEDSSVLPPELTSPSYREEELRAVPGKVHPRSPSPEKGSVSDGDHPKDLLEMSSESLKGQTADPETSVEGAGSPEHSYDQEENRQSLADSVGSVDRQTEDLSESKLFTHEEAESVYMSATSNAASSDSYLPAMPGAWGSPKLTGQEPDSSAGGQGPYPSEDETVSTPKAKSQPANPHVDDADLENSRHSLGSPRFPPAGGSPVASNEESFDEPTVGITEVSKKVVEIDRISIWIPSSSQSVEQPVDNSPDAPSRHSSNDMKDSTVGVSEQGGKSAPSTHISSLSRRDSTGSAATFEALGQSAIRPPDRSAPQTSHDGKGEDNIDVDVSSADVQFDIAAGWLLVKIGQRAITAWKPEKPAEGDVHSANSTPTIFPLSLSLKSFSLKFVGHISERIYPSEASFFQGSTASFTSLEEIILRATISGLRFHPVASKNPKLRLEVSHFSFGDASEDFISFDEDLKMRESTRDILSPTHNDISASIIFSQDSLEVDLNTLPIHVSLNIQKLDEIFSWLGGLSNILEVGSSIASISTVRGGKAGTGRQRPRGVHFEPVPAQKPVPAKSSSLPLKTNARIGGIVVDLIGEHCGVKLTTTAAKIVSRSEGIGMQVDKAKLTGPHCFDYGNDTAAKINFSNIRIEYLFAPKEVDLDRLLSLLTPSKDKYDEDDDIMLDTLFRQRKQGSVLRVTVEGVKSTFSRLDRLEQLSRLGAELTKLSSVAKYLPEDDRAGILTLGLIRDLDARVHVGGDIGDIRLTSRNIEVAHVSIPSLIASQIASIAIVRNGEEELLGEAVPSSPDSFASDPPLPMLMARLVADEMEPTIKFKLCNLRAEYTVSSIMAFFGLRDDMTPEDVAANMAHSVLNLAENPSPQEDTMRRPSQSTGGSESSKSLSKPTKFAISMRDCLIGLNPRDMPSRALAVFTFAKFLGTMHKDESSIATLDIRKASLLIIDDVRNADPAGNSHGQMPSTPQTDHVQLFSNMGYVPVCYVSSALATVKIMQLDASGDKSLDVEVKDDLLILETCADSTQTLINLLNGLKPPTPPSTDLKYRTEVMPIQDMISSLTGDAFTMDPETGSEGLSDHVEVTAEDAGSEDLEYVSDFYPYRQFDKLEGEDDLAGSGEMDTGLASFHTETHIDSSVSELEFQDDHFTKKSAVGGTAHRWDSTQNTYGLANEIKLHGSPLRVRIRDVHVIWNLFDGYDWQRTRDEISKHAKNVEEKAQKKWASGGGRRPSAGSGGDDDLSVVGDCLFNSIYIEIPANSDPRELSHNINHGIDDLASETGSYATTTTVTATPSRPDRTSSVRRKKLRLARSKHHKMTFELKGISADLVVFPPGSGETQSSLDVRVNDLEIFDHVPTSTWKKFATYMHDAGERETGTSMVHLEILNVKPVPDLAASEIVLKVSTSYLE